MEYSLWQKRLYSARTELPSLLTPQPINLHMAKSHKIHTPMPWRDEGLGSSGHSTEGGGDTEFQGFHHSAAEDPGWGLTGALV